MARLQTDPITPCKIGIVGAGYCGTVLAARLLQSSARRPLEIVLIERGGEMGRGMAYAVHEHPYLLNVPAGRLSADPRDANHFLRFAQRRAPSIGAEDFLPRALYGTYLQSVLAEAERKAAPGNTLTRLHDEVRDLAVGRAGVTMALAGGGSLTTDQAVLALGNPLPASMPWAAKVKGHSAYRHDPWKLPVPAPRDTVLVVGNGLTMADAVYFLSHDPARTPLLHTLSRHGLLALPQTSFRPAAVRGDGEAFLAKAASLRQLTAMTRLLSKEVQHRGGDWREVVTFVRSLAPALWRKLPDAERRRFMRHLQVYWDVHRHRLPIEVAARIDGLRRDGRMRVHAGHIESVEPDGERLRVVWRPRGTKRTHDIGQASSTVADLREQGTGARDARTQRVELRVDLLVNATGPDYSLARSADPLMAALREAGLICADPLGLGIRTGPCCECLDARGDITPRLYYLGPMLRADYWEATAAAELLGHAERLAGRLTAVS